MDMDTDHKYAAVDEAAMQLMIDAKYTNAFQQTLEELHIPFETSGSFPKRLSKHDIPLR